MDICSAHSVPSSRRRKAELISALSSHRCSSSCHPRLFAVFSGLGTARRLKLPLSVGIESDLIESVPTNRAELLADMDMTVAEPQEEAVINQHFPHMADKSARFNIIREWQARMHPSEWVPLPCAVCAQCPKGGLQVVPASDVPLDLLTNPSLMSEHIPNTYNWEAYDHAILYPIGLHDISQKGDMDLCGDCYHDLMQAHRQPLNSLANFQYYAIERLPDDVRLAFEHASMFDLMLVSRARATRITHLFSSKRDSPTYGHNPETSQSYSKGNVAILPQDNVHLRDVLPPPHSEIAEAMCALFVGGNIQPIRANIAQLKPALISKSAVMAMLQFLLSQNRWYKQSGVKFSASNFIDLYGPDSG
jgi:hypothetical protein